MIHFTDQEIRAFALGVLVGAAIMIPQCLKYINDTAKWYKQGKLDGMVHVVELLNSARFRSKRVGELWRVGRVLRAIEYKLDKELDDEQDED